MNLAFLQLPSATRGTYIKEAATKRDIHAAIMEKDFWVCWLLAVLFDSSFADAMVFKGGTSLSKVHGVIDRFSEDIDLSLSPSFVGVSDTEIGEGSSRNKANKWMKRAEEQCGAAVRENVQPELERIAVQILGTPERSWFEYNCDPVTNSPVIFFNYPTTQAPGFGYIKRSVKLEFGSLTDQQPVGRHPVRPWLAEEFPEAFADWRCEVIALELVRSFWEKATILHTEYYRPTGNPTPPRFSRHFADTAAIASHDKIEAAIDNADMRERVVNWKSQFFASGWARYDLAKPGTFRLVPPDARKADLRSDYDAMRDMYLTAPPKFDEILETLARLEQSINEERSV